MSAAGANNTFGLVYSPFPMSARQALLGEAQRGRQWRMRKHAQTLRMPLSPPQEPTSTAAHQPLTHHSPSAQLRVRVSCPSAHLKSESASRIARLEDDLQDAEAFVEELLQEQAHVMTTVVAGHEAAAHAQLMQVHGLRHELEVVEAAIYDIRVSQWG